MTHLALLYKPCNRASGINYMNSIPGNERGHTIPGEQLNPSSSVQVTLYLRAVNDGQSGFTGPVLLPQSQMGVSSATTEVRFQIAP